MINIEEKLRETINMSMDEISRYFNLPMFKSFTLINMVLDIYRQDYVLHDKYHAFKNLKYTTFRVILSQYIEKIQICDIEVIIGEVNRAIRTTEAILDALEAVANELPCINSKEAFYNLMGNNHLFMLSKYETVLAYIIDDLINALKSHNPPVPAKLNISDADAKLFAHAKDKKITRIERVIEILTQHGGGLSYRINYNEIVSNLDKLDISPDDIYSLQLFLSAKHKNRFKVIRDMQESVFVKDEKKSITHSSFSQIFTGFFFFLLDYSPVFDEFYPYRNTIEEWLVNLKRCSKNISKEYMKQHILDLSDLSDDNILILLNNVMPEYIKPIQADLNTIQITNIKTSIAKDKCLNRSYILNRPNIFLLWKPNKNILSPKLKKVKDDVVSTVVKTIKSVKLWAFLIAVALSSFLVWGISYYQEDFNRLILKISNNISIISEDKTDPLVLYPRFILQRFKYLLKL
ncbi:hypothetical protein NEPAR04_1724 [Nematocida parisii]|nr:hypothetical protein NEPAR08_1815 [Nematocida parisii]KAI5130972.1 hypothetical protein NEPAR03_2257 [Nematocida parisii]KAI5143059.1 hypothetical protein NEPAR04_1724 [Nematocida parisii]